MSHQLAQVHCMCAACALHLYCMCSAFAVHVACICAATVHTYMQVRTAFGVALALNRTLVSSK